MELLLAHLHERLFPNEDNTEQLFIENDTLYEHPILNIKYTSYEVQQETDIIHLGYGRTGVMVYTPMLRENESEPWSYANVLAVYHMTVCTASNPEPQTVSVLWVRWMQRNAVGLTGPNSQNYTQVSYVPWSDTPGSAFDFIDPSHIIRGCHLVPAFALGRTRNLLDPSVARDPGPEGDWRAYYANRYGLDSDLLGRSRSRCATLLHRFVDRDAFARFSGIGIGCQHPQANQILNIQVGPDFTPSAPDSQPGGGDSAESGVDESGDDAEDSRGPGSN